MTKQKPLLFPSVPNGPAYLRRIPSRAEVTAGLVVVHNSVSGTPRLGSNGFRAWLARPAARYVRYDCKWAAHLAVQRPHGRGWAMRVKSAAHRRLKLYVAVAAISLSPPARK